MQISYWSSVDDFARYGPDLHVEIGIGPRRQPGWADPGETGPNAGPAVYRTFFSR